MRVSADLSPWLRIVILLMAGYALLAVAAHFLSLRMLFPKPPVGYQLDASYTRLTTPDGVRLAARYWPNPNAKYTLLYLHGNYEDLGSIAEYIPDFVKAGYAVFAFDYRGYGWSEGRPTEPACYADAKLAYDYVRTTLGVRPNRLIIFGYSLGGGMGVELVRSNPAAGLVLQGVFASAYRVRLPIPLFPGDKFRNLAKAPELRLPVLVIHGTDDRTVPVSHGEAIFAALTCRKKELIIAGGPHGGLADYAGACYWDTLREFTDSL